MGHQRMRLWPLVITGLLLYIFMTGRAQGAQRITTAYISDGTGEGKK